MRIVIQRVLQAHVSVDGNTVGAIENGLMILAGFETGDKVADLEWASKKIVQMRIFNDEGKVPNLSLMDVNGEILLVSQFTLHALIKKGNRPGYNKAAPPELAKPLYEKFISLLEIDLGKKIATGTFGADMKVMLINDGPVTILIDTKNKE
ncbi:MAG: D-aminoacyl-tRNA deacylase [Ferruginibacter sp.]